MNPCRYEIVQSLPGRLRIRIKGLKGNPYFANSLEKTLKRYDFIHRVKANSQTGKALIIFDNQKLSAKEVNELLTRNIVSIIKRVAPLQLEKMRKEYEEYRKRKENQLKGLEDIFEPEDLPLQTQIVQVVATGLVLLALIAKRCFWGKGAWTGSSRIQGFAALTTIVTGYPILRSGIDNLLKKKKLNNDFLISAATLVSLIMKESITGLMVVGLVNLSTLFQTLTLEKSRKAIKDMLQGKEESAWVEVDGTLVSVPIEDLEVGNIVVCHVGDKIPVDGEVVEGEAAVSQAIITGESMPITKGIQDKVYSGSIVEQGALHIRAEKVGNDTSVARIIHLVEEASEVRAPIENMADKYADKIVPLSFGLAALVYLLTRDFKRSMTMLIVACPCAAGLATPTAISASMGNAAKNGILIKGGSHLEQVGKTNVVLFDKTGTLTEGNPTVKDIILLQEDYTEDSLLQLAASVEAYTNHPLAKAITNVAEERGISLLSVEDKDVVIGFGVNGTIEGANVFVGNAKFMKANKINTLKAKVKANKLNLLGQTVIYVAYNEVLIGLIGIADKIRKDSSEAIRNLRTTGIEEIGLITGDCTQTAKIVGREIGIDQVWSNVLPEGKVGVVDGYHKEGKIVTMVGEGINDSPALAKADIGIAMGSSGTDVAIESADIVLAGDDPLKIPAVINLSNHTMEVVKQNFAFAVGVNALGLLLGAGKFISPLSAAILHNLSTFGVVVNSSRLLNHPINGQKGRRSFARANRYQRARKQA